LSKYDTDIVNTAFPATSDNMRTVISKTLLWI